MTKIYAEKPDITELELRLKSLDKTDDFHKEKNKEFFKIKLPMEYSYEGIDLKIIACQESIVLGEIALIVDVSVPSLDYSHSFNFINPPVKVHNGTYRKEIIPGTSKLIDMKNFKVDILEALKEIVGQAIVLEIKGAD